MNTGNTEILKSIDIPEATISLHTSGIVFAYYKDNTVLDIPLQNRILECFNEITGKKQTPFLFHAGKDVVVTKEARDNAIATEEQSPCKAIAVLVDNLAYKLIADFYMYFNKPKRPYKVFNNKNEAIEWLKNHLD